MSKIVSAFLVLSGITLYFKSHQLLLQTMVTQCCGENFESETAYNTHMKISHPNSNKLFNNKEEKNIFKKMFKPKKQNIIDEILKDDEKAKEGSPPLYQPSVLPSLIPSSIQYNGEKYYIFVEIECNSFEMMKDLTTEISQLTRIYKEAKIKKVSYEEIGG